MASFYPSTPDSAARPASVRVQCEAKDCRALLEVAVVPDCPDGPLIVRCGSCQRLLEVNLSLGGGQGGVRAPQQASYQMVKPPSLLPAHVQYRQHPSMPGGDHRTPLPMRHQLVQPPPLSRYHSLPTHQMRQGYGPDDQSGRGHAAYTQYTANMQALSAGSPYHSTTHFSGFDEHSPNTHFQSMHDTTYDGGRKKKKEKKSKPRNPSPYNLFMSREVKRIKAENPKLDHRVAFKQAANNWAKSPHNCSNQRMNVFGPGAVPGSKPEVSVDVKETETPSSTTPEPSDGLMSPKADADAIKDIICEDKVNGVNESTDSVIVDGAPDQPYKADVKPEVQGVKRPLEEDMLVLGHDKRTKLGEELQEDSGHDQQVKAREAPALEPAKNW